MGVRSKNQLVSQRSQETGERQPLLPEAKGGTGYSRTTQEVKRSCTKGKIVSVWDFCLAQGPSGITHITLHSRAKGNGESLVKYCSKGRPDCLLSNSTNFSVLRGTGTWFLFKSTSQRVGHGDQGWLVGYSLAMATEVEAQELNIRAVQHEAVGVQNICLCDMGIVLS